MGYRRGVGDLPPGECLSACQGLEGWGGVSRWGVTGAAPRHFLYVSSHTTGSPSLLLEVECGKRPFLASKHEGCPLTDAE